MTIPISSTQITIKRPPAADDGADPYDAKSPMVTVVTGVRALFSSPSGGASLGGGEFGDTGSQEAVQWTLLADPCDLKHTDTVYDETTGQPYAVAWAKLRTDPDHELDHMVAGVNEVKGAST